LIALTTLRIICRFFLITLVDDLINAPPQEFLSLELMLKVEDLSSSS